MGTLAKNKKIKRSLHYKFDFYGMVQDQILFSLECLETNHVADGHCDDIANTEICSYDGGDCCGCNVNTQYCSDCQCLDPNGSGGGTTGTMTQSTTPVPTTTGTTIPPVPGSFGNSIEEFYSKDYKVIIRRELRNS